MLHYVDEGNGETIVLLHGFCGSSDYWQNVIPRLSQNYRVIAPDLIGHGKSQVPMGTMMIEDYAEQILHLLDQLRVENVSMFGHSMGGYITLAFAEKYPQRLRSFSLIHSTALPDDEKGKEAREKNIELIKSKGMEPFIHQLVPKLFAPGHVHSMEEQIQQVINIGMNTTARGAITALEAMKDRADRTHVLQNRRIPVLLIAGGEDQLIPAEKAFRVDGEHITKVLLDTAGHMSMYEDSNGLVSALEQFINQL